MPCKVTAEHNGEFSSVRPGFFFFFKERNVDLHIRSGQKHKSKSVLLLLRVRDYAGKSRENMRNDGTNTHGQTTAVNIL